MEPDLWALRIGPAAAQTFRRARRTLFVTLGSWALLLVAYLAASTLFQRNSDAWNWYGLLGAIVLIAAAFLVLVPYRITQARARREAAVFLSLSKKTGETTLPAAALKSLTMFDNLMWSRGISPAGRYVPHPSPSWVANNTGRFGVGKLGNGRFGGL
jgi:hypothetical protein